MTTTRQERVKEFLKTEISDIIRKEIKDPRVGFVTITDAEVSKDMRHGRIYVTVLGEQSQKEETLRILQHAAGYIRGEFGRRARMRIIPELTFKLDTAVEQGIHIFELLEQVKHESEPE